MVKLFNIMFRKEKKSEYLAKNKHSKKSFGKLSKVTLYRQVKGIKAEEYIFESHWREN